MWFKVDDRLAFHPKVMAAGNAAIGLWVRSGAWSASQLSDGVVSPEIVAAMNDPRQHLAARLVDVGLWVPGSGGTYEFHDWEAWQPTKSEVELRRTLQEETAREANHRRWHVRRGVFSESCKWCQQDRPADG